MHEEPASHYLVVRKEGGGEERGKERGRKEEEQKIKNREREGRRRTRRKRAGCGFRVPMTWLLLLGPFSWRCHHLPLTPQAVNQAFDTWTFESPDTNYSNG